MILTIAGANFSGANIGTNDSVRVSVSVNSAVLFTAHGIPGFVNKGAEVSWTITLKEGYTFGSVDVSMEGGGSITKSISGSTLTIASTNVTGKITINVPTNKEITDGEEPGTGGDSGNTGTTEVRYSGTISSGSWKAANVSSYYKICNLNDGERLDSIQVKFGTNDVTPNMAIVNNSGEVLYMKDLNKISDTQSTNTNINYTASEAVTLCVGGASGSMGYSTTNIATGSVNMSYCDIVSVGETVTFKDGGNITFALEVTIIK